MKPKSKTVTFKAHGLRVRIPRKTAKLLEAVQLAPEVMEYFKECERRLMERQCDRLFVEILAPRKPSRKRIRKVG